MDHTISKVTGHYAVGLGRVEAFYIDPLNDDRIFWDLEAEDFGRQIMAVKLGQIQLTF